MSRASSGFTLIEVLIAIGILVIAAVSLAQILILATRATRAGREQTSASILAAAKMDQLRSLTWTASASDRSTNVSDPALGGDGGGLTASPLDALARNIPPYVDYLDDGGSWVGNGPEPPGNAVFIRRWSVIPLPGDPDRTLLLQVLVTTVALDRMRSPERWTARTGIEALLVSVRTRKEP
jgi:prepilin-type N-terminal cleavage/methylation domain-containing protein